VGVFCYLHVRAYTQYKLKNEFGPLPEKAIFFVERDAMASFSPLRHVERKIPTRAPVKSDRRSSPEGTRSALDGHSE
jgi:hypothetical protein